LEKIKNLFVAILIMFLTKSEQRLLELLPEGVFNVNELSARVPLRYRIELLARLAKKKAVQRIKKGVYFQSRGVEGRLELALGLHPDGYLGFLTALKHYKIINEELSRVFVVTEKASGIKNFDGFDVQLIPMHSDFYGIVQEGRVRWSTKAKTLFDCLKKPNVVGGYQRVLSAVGLLQSNQDWKEFLYYLTNSSSKSFRQKTGFLLQGRAPEWFLKKLEKSNGKKVVARLAWGKEKGFDKRWGVYYGAGYS
jgi:predicted transcriptional regulator of viral defense system